MYTLLSSLADYGYQGTTLDNVNKWIQSGLIDRNTARLAYDKQYIRMRAVANDNGDLFNPDPDDSIEYIYISKLGLTRLHMYNKKASYGHQKWNPNKRLNEFLRNYQNDDE